MQAWRNSPRCGVAEQTNSPGDLRDDGLCCHGCSGPSHLDPNLSHRLMSPSKLHPEQNCLLGETWKSSVWIEVWEVTLGPLYSHPPPPPPPPPEDLLLKDISSPYIPSLFGRYWQHKSHFLPTETLLAKWINVRFTCPTHKKILKITNDFKQAIQNKITCSRIESLSVLSFSLKMQCPSCLNAEALSHLNRQRWS